MITIVQADITTLAVDVIVNAANNSLLGGGGVDGAIHQVAGPELLSYCRNLKGCATGDAKISPGFNLSAKWIVHTVGPVWQGGSANEASLLKSCYTKSLALAASKQAKSIAFPAISTGVYGYPKELATEIAIAKLHMHVDEYDEIIACSFSDEDFKLYRRVLASKS